ncbi:MAG: argininosuccinate lyase, partial [Lachnospiraceae bacterium]|nr:argininosuccinate lyase [Lachnospiraceae bacterium]
MAQLWGGRFTKPTDEKVYAFNASVNFDKRMLKQDVCGSIAHSAMLAKQGIISEEDGKVIAEGLEGIYADVLSGKLEITDQYEDIHSFCEAVLTERVGDAGKR